MRSDLPGPHSAAIFKSRHAEGMARRLRKTLTPAEKALWKELRRLPLEHSHFRKQAPFGPYVVDFVCHAARIIIEVDGGAHEAPDQVERDAARQAWIESRGYKVMRMPNALVLRDVAEAARQILSETKLRMRLPAPLWGGVGGGGDGGALSG